VEVKIVPISEEEARAARTGAQQP
ncbi:MAG: hypothetical protein RL299_725, partial [Pseudomonadota bacterium]